MAIVSTEQIIKVLRQYNPWWRNPSAIKEESKACLEQAQHYTLMLCLFIINIYYIISASDSPPIFSITHSSFLFFLLAEYPGGILANFSIVSSRI